MKVMAVITALENLVLGSALDQAAPETMAEPTSTRPTHLPACPAFEGTLSAARRTLSPSGA